jgi:NAD(P)-dependent dehydrogenase (short-subunit alcohol dehydrogenase family)
VLITGAARRIGRAIALDLAQAGWRIGIHYRSSATAAQNLAGEIAALGGKTALLDADLADAEAVRTLIPRCGEQLGAPCCLINNASLFMEDTIGTLDEESWRTHIDTNLRAPVLLSQSFAAGLPEGQNGNIINIVDQRVLKPSPDFFSYTVSKAGLWWVTQTMAQALAPRIRVNAVSPGPVLASIHQTQEDFAAEAESTLLKRGASPEEIAAAVRYLLNAPAVTGQMIAVDGGQHLAG